MAIFLLIAVAFVSAYAVIQKGQEKAYTALYFPNPLQPAEFNSSEGSLTVNFTIENREGMAVDYTYVLSVYQSETPQAMKNISKRIFLKDNEIAKISEKIIAGEETKSAIVSVELYITGRNETYRRIWMPLEDIAGAGKPQ